MQPPASSPFGRLFAFAAGALLLIVGFMVSLVVFAVIAVLTLAASGWFWWKTRRVRKAMHEHPSDGNIIEGESVVINESVSARRPLPPGGET